ncbi:hypothetical protein, partial [Nocardia cyriacigeorgica]|uniref:hypothetical protein n=1 Tax=Nocardia cyriacigeorgica TaxID=135487 RepID=UPI002457B3CF
MECVRRTGMLFLALTCDDLVDLIAAYPQRSGSCTRGGAGGRSGVLTLPPRARDSAAGHRVR